MKTRQSISAWFKSVAKKVNHILTEDMSEYDATADYDTRVKLPEWQLAALKKRQAKRDQQQLK